MQRDDAVVPSLWEEWCNYIFSVGDITQWKEWCIYDFFSVGGMIQLFLCSPKDNTFIHNLLRRWCSYIFPSKGRCKNIPILLEGQCNLTYFVGEMMQLYPFSQREDAIIHIFLWDEWCNHTCSMGRRRMYLYLFWEVWCNYAYSWRRMIQLHISTLWKDWCIFTNSLGVMMQ